MLAQAGLLKPIDLQANLVDGRSYALKGVLVVDEQKLSLRNLSTLMDLKVKAGNGHNGSDT